MPRAYSGAVGVGKRCERAGGPTSALAIGRKAASIRREETSEQRKKHCDEKEDSHTAEIIQNRHSVEGP
jgi:hypothetical protein